MTVARKLLDVSTLCAIATVSPGNRAHVNTAYFAWSPQFDIVWLSAPEARHSRNLLTNKTVAVAVFDSNQTWGKPDRGIQLFGSAREATGAAGREAGLIYTGRLPDYAEADLTAYRLYRFRPNRLKVFDERALGAGVFVTANVTGGGRLVWAETEVYRARE